MAGGDAGRALGIGASVGSVVPTQGAIIPAAVRVDVDCGMAAVCTTLTAKDLPDSLARLRSEVKRAIPVGNGPGDDAWAMTTASIAAVMARAG